MTPLLFLVILDEELKALELKLFSLQLELENFDFMDLLIGICFELFELVFNAGLVLCPKCLSLDTLSKLV